MVLGIYFYTKTAIQIIDNQRGFGENTLLWTVLCLPISWRFWTPVNLSLQWSHNGRDGVSDHQPHDFYLTVYTGADQRKHQSSASLAFVRGIHRWPVNSPHKGPVTRKTFPFDDVIMWTVIINYKYNRYFSHQHTCISINIRNLTLVWRPRRPINLIANLIMKCTGTLLPLFILVLPFEALISCFSYLIHDQVIICKKRYG